MFASPMSLPTRLRAPRHGWQFSTDVIVVGSGVAGLTAAINIRKSGHRVALVTKAAVDEGSTRWAQGGIAAALHPEDSPGEHFHDTLVAGAGLCDADAVRTLVTEGPAAVRRLIALGAQFDVDSHGEIALTREGGHLRDRIAHAGGDATGVEISRALVAAVALDDGIELIEHALVLDFLRDAVGAVQGVTLHVMGEGRRDGVGAVLAPAVVLATGGIGQVFAQTTNPRVATGDGIAAAVRAGAEVSDLEFVQFHPTVMWLGPLSEGQQPLVSEALRGEGATLVDHDGKRFMQDIHPLADLAPRDVVAKAITRRMRESGTQHLWLDGRHLGIDGWTKRFPSVLASCRANGIDPIRDLIPVAPAQHYHSGGVATDLHGRTTVAGLFACGEVAHTGAHGANRLASNSLLEGLVFAERIGTVLADGLPPRRPALGPHALPAGSLLSEEVRPLIQRAMTEGAAVLRSENSLLATEAALASLAQSTSEEPSTEAWEATNLHTVASLLARSALLRRETRGSHWREDVPEQDDERWQVRLVSRIDPDGRVSTRSEAVVAPRDDLMSS
jgi:L-aspartate oxidase